MSRLRLNHARIGPACVVIGLLTGVSRLVNSQPVDQRHEGLRRWTVASTPKLHELRLDILNYPRMCGSTSTQPLAALIACHCFGLDHTWAGREQRWPEWMPHKDVEYE